MFKSISTTFRTVLVAAALATAALSTGCAVEMQEPIDVAAAQTELDDSAPVDDSDQVDADREEIEDADEPTDLLDGAQPSSANTDASGQNLDDGHLESNDLVHPGAPVTH